MSAGAPHHKQLRREREHEDARPVARFGSKPKGAELMLLFAKPVRVWALVWMRRASSSRARPRVVSRASTRARAGSTTCQSGVFAAYVSDKGHALIVRRLYLPQDWEQGVSAT